MSVAVAFHHVSKDYRGGRRYRTLRDELAGVPGMIRGRRRPAREAVKALSDVSFEIPEGQCVGIMGPNGSGKTTALKLMSRVTYPTSGALRVAGRVGALIDVGTGLHPELTGRENISLYGRILGLSGNDIRSRFNSIVDFADIGNALDQPVKQYSSGMQLRLGFSLASHLEPDILLVDEAVSVGDVGFQLRCLERMAELTKSGITVLFVSHVPSLVARLCSTGILLDRGRAAMIAPIAKVIDAYMVVVRREQQQPLVASDVLHIRSWAWEFHPSQGRFLGDLVVHLHLDVDNRVRNPKFGVALTDGRPGNLLTCSMLADRFQTGDLSESVTLSCEIRELPLEPGTYMLWMSAMNDAGISYLIEPRCLGYVQLENGEHSDQALFAGTNGFGPVRAPYAWDVKRRAQ
jgi:ABC-type polysaccharide/polyol phosphate transport system ATPase subunit